MNNIEDIEKINKSIKEVLLDLAFKKERKFFKGVSVIIYTKIIKNISIEIRIEDRIYNTYSQLINIKVLYQDIEFISKECPYIELNYAEDLKDFILLSIRHLISTLLQNIYLKDFMSDDERNFFEKRFYNLD